MRRMLGLTALVIAGAATACGGDGAAGASCLEATGARVCLAPTPGGADLEASGLAPGSEVVIEPAPGGQSRIPVGDDGSLVGAMAFLGGSPADRADIRVQIVEATTAEGDQLAGELRLAR